MWNSHQDKPFAQYAKKNLNEVKSYRACFLTLAISLVLLVIGQGKLGAVFISFFHPKTLLGCLFDCVPHVAL